tara:strand:- start:935 stop:1156 length:222 start_codon:yes stop_codon:yes gene_type:complete
METINYVKTGGQFGRKRVLPTFIIKSFKTDLGVIKYSVTDERNLERGSCGTFLTLQDAIKAFKPYADQRTRLF